MTQTNHCAPHDGERGAVFVLTAASLFVLLVFAAFALDLANVWVERRSDQNAADVAAMSGAQFTAGVEAATAISLAEAEVRRITAQNLGVSDAEWTACTDADALSIASSTPCVSFDGSLTRMRVRIPDQSVDTLFASVIGIDQLTTNAFAEVEIHIESSGNVLPFGFGPTAGLNPEICLRDNGGSSGSPLKPKADVQAPPCDGGEQGNFGFLDFKRYTDSSDSRCSSDYLIENMSAGIDHSLKLRTDPDGPMHENALSGAPHACPNGDGSVDRTLEQTGAPKLHEGLVSGIAGYPGRLTDPQTPYQTTILFGERLDNKPLWEFINPILSFNDDPATGAPSSCDPAVIAAGAPPHDAMIQCLGDYGTGAYTVDMFTGKALGDPTEYDLLESPRWAYVPALHKDFSDVGGGGTFQFVRFQPVFLQTIYYFCNVGCNEFNPGEGPPPQQGNRAQAVTALQVPPEALPDVVNEHAPGTRESIDYILVR